MARILFIHQNFPGQFLHWSVHLARIGHHVHALSLNPAPTLPGVQQHRYSLPPSLPSEPALPDLRELQVKMLRGMACAQALRQLQQQGFAPDLIVAHPAWGEVLYAREIWPQAKQLHFLEFFYKAEGQDVGFDPEFSDPNTDAIGQGIRLRNKNINGQLALDSMDWGVSPTQWQKSTYPKREHARIEVIFDGVDSQVLCPNPQAQFLWSPNTATSTTTGTTTRSASETSTKASTTPVNATPLTLGRNDEVVTFVARNLEPYRGYHRFMRALPALLRGRPRAQVVIVGGDQVSYGAQPPQGQTWKTLFLQEVAAELDLRRVHFVGRLSRPALTALLQVSRCHVYLTYPFVLSWSCVEAMSIGCPIVASDTAPVQEFIQHGHNGVLVDFFDTPALSQAVCDVLAQATWAQKLGQQARQTVLERYDLQGIALPRQRALIQQMLKA